MEERRWACLPANGTLRMGTCGTAPPPRRAAPRATLGAMDPRKAQARSENNLVADVNVVHFESFGGTLLLVE